MQKICWIIILCLLIPLLATGHENPFGGPAPESTESVQERPDTTAQQAQERAAFDMDDFERTTLWERFVDLNRRIQTAVAGYLRTLSEDFSFGMLLWILLASIAYGFVHSSGPGHGKVIVVSYFMDHGQSWRDALRMALIISLTHTGTALLIATVFQIILSNIPDQQTQMDIRSMFTIISGIVIAGIGVYMLIEKIRRARHNDAEEADAIITKSKSSLAVGIAAGIVPCPLSMAVLLLAVSFGFFYIGVLSVLGMSLGMFILLFGIGFITIRSRSAVLQRFKEGSRLKSILIKTAGIASAVLILFFGIIVAAAGAA